MTNVSNDHDRDDPKLWLNNHKAFVLGAPIAGGAASFFLLYLAGQFIAPMFGIDTNAPLKQQPQASFILNVLIGVMLLCAAVGFFSGLAIVVRTLMSACNLGWREAWRATVEISWSSKPPMSR
jgi:hypothetical protein